MKRKLVLIKEKFNLENLLLGLTSIETMSIAISRILIRRTKVQEATAHFSSLHHFTPQEETQQEKDREEVKKTIDDCSHRLQEVQTNLMLYKRNKTFWGNESSIKNMQQNIKEANISLLGIKEKKQGRDEDFEQLPKEEDIRFAKWAVDSAYNTVKNYIESVHNVDTLWTDHLKKRIFTAFRRENAMSVRKVTDFVDRHYIKEINEKLRRLNMEMMVDIPEIVSQFGIKDDKNKASGLYPLLKEI